MGAYPEHEQPMLPRHGGGDSSRRKDPCDDCAACLCIFCLSVFLTAVTIIPLGWYLTQSSMTPEYSVAITAVSVEPATDLQPGRGMLSPVFNLTVGIASHSALSGGCISPGTTIEVSYWHLHLPMSSGRAPDMCVGPGQSVEPRPAVARGHDVAVPGFLVDRLAEDMRRGEAMFQVKLTRLQESRSHELSVVTCWARVEEATGAALLDTPCTQSWRDIDSMPKEDSGYVPHPVLSARPHSV